MAFIRNVDKLIEGLENKFFTEARAKAALAPELATEAAARAAGDSAEAAARQAADSALDQRLQVVEGSGEGSVAKAEQDAKDYADQKVAALVNSAPAVLDTLKELSDALGSDPNFATTVSNQIGVVDAKVSQEILDRQSAVSAEQSARQSADQALDGRLDILEADSVTKTYVDGEVSDLQGQITQEISDRQSAVSSEQSARELADSNLSGRISVLEQDPTTKSYVDGEVSDLQGQINQEISDRQSAVSSEQSRAQSAEQALDGRLDILEQDPTTKSYVDGEVLDLQGQITQEISDRQSDVNAEESRAMSAEAALDGRIDILEQDPTTKAYVDQEVSAEESRSMLAEQGLQSDIDAEEVRAMAAESALDGRIDVLEQDPTTKTYVDGKVVMLEGEVSSEESRAMAAEQALDGRLDVLEQDPTTKTYVDGEVMDLQGQISQEISDRQSAVSGEASARQMADNALDARLDVLEQDPTTKSYVDGIQSALDSRLDVLESDPVTKSYVDGEVSGLQGQVNTEKGRIDAILSAADADKDSFAEIVQLINSVDASNDSAFAGYVLSNDAALAQEVSDREAAVSAEQLSREAEDSAINAKFGSMVSYLTGEVAPDMTQVVDDTRTYLQNEMIAANEQLQGTIQQNQENLQSSIGGVQEQLNQEISDREAAEGLLDGRLDVLETDPTTKSYVDSEISSEASARSTEDLTMFKKDGSRQLTGSILPNAHGTLNLGSNSARFDNVYGFTGQFSTGINVGTTNIWGNVNMNGSNSMLWYTDGAGNIGAAAANRPNDVYVKNRINLDSLTASKVMVSDASKNLISSSISSTELGYLSGLSSNAQTQLDSMLKLDGSRSMSGQLVAITGSSTSPSITFAADATSGISAGSAGNLNLITGGSNRFQISTSNGVTSWVAFRANASISLINASNAHITWTTDGAGDIGASAGSRPNNVYVKTGVVASSLTVTTMSSSIGAITCNAKFALNNGASIKYVTKAANYTLTTIDYVVAVSDLSAPRVMTLPSAGVGSGTVFIVKDQTGAASQTNYIQIAPQAGQTIDGQVDYKIVMPYESVMLIFNGSNWFII
jgi:hypothetical protein